MIYIQLYNSFPEDTILDLLSILLVKSVYLLIKWLTSPHAKDSLTIK